MLDNVKFKVVGILNAQDKFRWRWVSNGRWFGEKQETRKETKTEMKVKVKVKVKGGRKDPVQLPRLTLSLSHSLEMQLFVLSVLGHAALALQTMQTMQTWQKE